MQSSYSKNILLNFQPLNHAVALVYWLNCFLKNCVKLRIILVLESHCVKECLKQFGHSSGLLGFFLFHCDFYYFALVMLRCNLKICH